MLRRGCEFILCFIIVAVKRPSLHALTIIITNYYSQMRPFNWGCSQLLQVLPVRRRGDGLLSVRAGQGGGRGGGEDQ